MARAVTVLPQTLRSVQQNIQTAFQQDLKFPADHGVQVDPFQFEVQRADKIDIDPAAIIPRRFANPGYFHKAGYARTDPGMVAQHNFRRAAPVQMRRPKTELGVLDRVGPKRGFGNHPDLQVFCFQFAGHEVLPELVTRDQRAALRLGHRLANQPRDNLTKTADRFAAVFGVQFDVMWKTDLFQWLYCDLGTTHARASR